jgi:predicted hydrocarbon binding protein
MPARDRKASSIAPEMDLAGMGPEEARELLARALVPEPKSGILRLSDQPCLIVRPEIIVSIQKQLEQTVGGSAKGILYMAGERSSEAGLKFFGALTKGISSPLTMEGAKRIIEVSALTGWGRTEIVVFDPERGRFAVARHNSPIAIAYGPSKKPVCHFLAGWMAGISRLLVGKELLCEETSCAAQGHDRCEFELQPMPTA